LLPPEQICSKRDIFDAFALIQAVDVPEGRGTVEKRDAKWVVSATRDAEGVKAIFKAQGSRVSDKSKSVRPRKVSAASQLFSSPPRSSHISKTPSPKSASPPTAKKRKAPESPKSVKSSKPRKIPESP